MSTVDIIDLLRLEAARLEATGEGAVWYLFGSYAYMPSAAADVDILIVCSVDKQTGELRNALLATCSDWPIHLLLMTTLEEAETDFVAKQNCHQFDPETASRS